jgi:hypothetical protein
LYLRDVGMLAMVHQNFKSLSNDLFIPDIIHPEVGKLQIGDGPRRANRGLIYSSRAVRGEWKIATPGPEFQTLQVQGGEAHIGVCSNKKLLEDISELAILSKNCKPDLRKGDPHYGVMNGLGLHVPRCGGDLVPFAFNPGTTITSKERQEHLLKCVRKGHHNFFSGLKCYDEELKRLCSLGLLIDGMLPSTIISNRLANGGHLDCDGTLSFTISSDIEYNGLPTYFLFTQAGIAVPLGGGTAVVWDGRTQRHCSSQGRAAAIFYAAATTKFFNNQLREI